jgi:uncharacterized protein YbjT (DUF2867 family)
MSARKLLVTGATGKQGGALIEALLSNKSSNFSIYGLTRDASSNSAKKLNAKKITMIEGETTNPGPIFEKIGKGVWGVFSVTIPGKNEEEQAKPLIDAAVANGVQYFVFTSVDRGGPSKSESDATYVPHFITKFNIEKHLKEKAAASPQKMAWTILRPVAFFDNLTPDFQGKSFSRIMKQMEPTRINMIGTKDIGRVAAQAFLDPENNQYKAYTLAGETMDYATMNKIFKEEVKRDMPLAPGIATTFFKFIIPDMGKMFQWFKEGNYSYDIGFVKEEHPDLQDFRTWLRTSSKFETKA